MKIIKNLTTVNFTNRNTDPKYIVMHYVGAESTAKNNATYFKSTYRGASAHYFVDEDDIYQVVEDNDTAWSVGDSGSGTMKGKVTNSNSINIELCVKKSGSSWVYEEDTLKNAAELVQYLMKEYDIDEDCIYRHYDVTAKSCPANYLTSSAWATLKKQLIGAAEITSSSTSASSTSTSSSSSSSGMSVKEFQAWLNDNYGDDIKECGDCGKAKLSEDNIFGAKTLAGAVVAYQAECNEQFKASLSKDGRFGTKSKAYGTKALVKKGSEGAFVYIVQGMLHCKGFYDGGLDGDAGSITDTAIENYQNSVGLDDDGKCGKDTYYKLMN